MKKFFPVALISLSLLAHAQEGPVATKILVTVDSSKDVQKLTAADLTINVDNHKAPPTTLMPVLPAGVQIALLIDDGLRESVGRELNTLRSFVTNLPAGTEIFIGYMSNGQVQQASAFTTDYAAAAANIRLPFGSPGISASPYFCVSDFVKRWPTEGAGDSAPGSKARFIMMITNGVDPYNGSTSIMNQNSPYVQAAQTDAQRAGVIVSSIYFADAGMRGQRASFSGQSYLAQIAEATGGRSYYQGSFNPVSLDPYLKEFNRDVAMSYIAGFTAESKRKNEMVQIKVQSKIPHLKVRSAQQVQPGNAEAGTGQ